VYVETAGGRLYFEESGEGKSVVMIHGGNLDCRMWDDQFPVFSRSCRAIRYDVRGHGRSDPAAEPYSDVEDLSALLAFLGVRRPVLIGLSLGGRIALDFALESPKAVAGLVLAAPGLSGYAFKDAEVGKTLGRVLRAVKDGDLPLARELLLEVPYWRQEDPPLAGRLKQILDGYSFRGWLHEELDKGVIKPAIGRLGSVTAPTLVVVGDQDVSDILRICDLLEEGIPGATEAVIPGTGHMLNMQKPDEFNRIVLEFLDRI
jgi:pimeloyl-ACP methyl ester carboxylesterase